jgi:hypothetical protein
LITELEFKERVRERAVIEERVSTRYLDRLQEAANEEEAARRTARTAASGLVDERPKVVTALNKAIAQGRAAIESADISVKAAEAVRSDMRDFLEENVELNQEARDSINETVRQAQDSGEFYGRFKYQGTNRDAYFRVRELALPENRQLPAIEALKKVYAGAHNDSERLAQLLRDVEQLNRAIAEAARLIIERAESLLDSFRMANADTSELYREWLVLREFISQKLWLHGESRSPALKPLLDSLDKAESAIGALVDHEAAVRAADERVEIVRRPLDHKKFLDMLIDDLEEKYIELLDGTRAYTANVDNYLKRLTTALDDDFNTQFYNPAFRRVRETSTYWDVQFGQTETTNILANNREFAKVEPSATMEFDLPARSIAISEAMNGAMALMNDVGALANDPTFLAMSKMQAGGSPAVPAAGSTGGFGVVRNVLPGLDTSTGEQIMAQNPGGQSQFGSNLENLIPDPAIYKFETGTGFEIRPVVQPDGQAVVFDFNYMYTTQVREPVRADEKHLGRVKRHFVDTEVQLSNFELREVSRYTVALKAARTSRGVPLLEDIPLAGALFRPLPSDESSLQQNVILGQATIFPTLFDLMGLRWAPTVADLDPLRESNREFVVRGRHRALENRVYDFSSQQVDEFLRIPQSNRRSDLYRSQETIPYVHPNGYQGQGLDMHESHLQEGHQPLRNHPQDRYIPAESQDESARRSRATSQGTRIERYPLELVEPGNSDSRSGEIRRDDN